MASSSAGERELRVDGGLRERAREVIPGGMYGHQNAGLLPEGFPQFFERGDGARIWDVDGNEYIDYLCSYGPILLGHRHPLSLGKLSPVDIYIAISNNIIVVVNFTISVSLGIQKSASCDDAKFTSLTNLLYAQVTDIDKS